MTTVRETCKMEIKNFDGRLRNSGGKGASPVKVLHFV